MAELVDSDLASQAHNPELTVDPRSSNAAVDRQILQLKLITNKLQKAYGGFYVDWIELEGLSALLQSAIGNTAVESYDR